MSAELKYTDRDVRENEDFAVMAREYVENYEGEFPFLIDCKMRLDSGLKLSVGMVRGILNCMRIDPRVPFDMPDPLPPEEGVVIQMPKRNKKKKAKYHLPAARKICPLLEAGIYHKHKGSHTNFYDAGYEYCYGLYRINRRDFELNATVKTEFVKAKTAASVLIHRASPHAFFRWKTLSHEYGWWGTKYGWPAADLHVHNPACHGARWLTSPILLKAEHIEEWNASESDPEKQLRFCRHCWPDGGPQLVNP